MSKLLTEINKTSQEITISIDAMGGDQGVGAILGGVNRSLSLNKHLKFLVHGSEELL